MDIKMHLGWWIVPAGFAFVGIVLGIVTKIATRKEPTWLGAGPLMLPNPAGMGRHIISWLLVLIGITLFAGHFLH